MVKLNMTNADSFRIEKNLIQYLGRQLRLGRLTLFLGAGISGPFGLPDWDNLVRKMFSKAGLALPKETNERNIDYLEDKSYQNRQAAFIEDLHDSLYRDVKIDLWDLRANPVVAAISTLMMASARGNTGEIITLNFDDILELYLKYHGYVVRSHYYPDHWRESADVSVYHVNGLVPYDLREPESLRKHLVFSQMDYSRQFTDAPWREIALSLLRRKTCLFIGVSGRDQFLDALLMAVKDTHASKAERTAFWGVTFGTSADDVAERLWKTRGVYHKCVADFDDELPRFLFRVCESAANNA